MIYKSLVRETYNGLAKMRLFFKTTILQDEKSSIADLVTSHNLYAIQQLLTSNMLTHERLVDILKNHYATSNSTPGEFTVNIVDLVCDHMDLDLINIFLKNMYFDPHTNVETINKITQCIRHLINLGGTLQLDSIAFLPNEIIEECVDIETLDTNVLLECIASATPNSCFKNKCSELLQRQEESIDKIRFAKSLLYCINDNTVVFSDILKCAHNQEDFEWIIFDVIKYVSINKIHSSVQFFPQNYVANKKISVILLMIGQVCNNDFTNVMHSDIIKYKKVEFSRYFAANDVAYPVKYKHGLGAYFNLHGKISSRMILVEEKYFEEHKASIYGFAKELLMALEQDDELQLFIASQ